MQITRVPATEHEQVLRVEDPASGLLGFIAVHSTVLGPAAGGLRMRDYGSEAAALDDVLRLSRGMSFKNAAAGLRLGGGKAVIMGDPARKSADLLRGFARGIDSLKGEYWTAEDMGMDPDDMAVIREVTPFVAGLNGGAFASGNPSPVTARGIFQSIRTTAKHVFGSPVMEGRRVALQGLGHVGWELAVLLKAAGVELMVADTDIARAGQAARCLGAQIVAPDQIHRARADIFAPCAIGGILNARSIPEIQAKAICGGANNQLDRGSDAAGLAERGILYAPDYVVNSGGIINVATEILRIRDREAFVEDKLAAIDATLDMILGEAGRTGRSPADLADHIVAKRIERPYAA